MAKKSEEKAKTAQETVQPVEVSELKVVATKVAETKPAAPAKQRPSVNRSVLYSLTAADAERINHRIQTQAIEGAPHQEGQQLPMTITRVHSGEGCVSGQVLLDADDSLYAFGVVEGDLPGQWSWPAFVPPAK